MSNEIARTERTKIRRLPKRGVFDRETIYKILDEAFVCHVGFTIDDQPFVIPTGYARGGDNLITHLTRSILGISKFLIIVDIKRFLKMIEIYFLLISSRLQNFVSLSNHIILWLLKSENRFSKKFA